MAKKAEDTHSYFAKIFFNANAVINSLIPHSSFILSSQLNDKILPKNKGKDGTEVVAVGREIIAFREVFKKLIEIIKKERRRKQS